MQYILNCGLRTKKQKNRSSLFTAVSFQFTAGKVVNVRYDENWIGNIW